jgi:hypothetical protein
MIPAVVYSLCTLTALACAILLFRAYMKSKAKLLFWSAICFAALAMENALVFVDFIVLGPETSLALARNSIGLVGLLLLLYGCIWDV